MAATSKIVTTGTGQAVDHIALGPGRHWLHFQWASGAGSATPKVRNSAGGTTWRTVTDSAGDVTIDSDDSIIVFGNAQYSVDVGTHTSALTVTTEQAE
jgi:hypothetical protein